MGPDEPERVSDQSSLKEEAYRRLRSAAQKYNVLQLGMTFAWVDNEENSEHERIRSIIADWLAHNGSQAGESLRLMPPGGKPMTRAWVSEVHSIVRTGFGNCRSWKDSRENCVVVKHVELVAEEKRQEGRDRFMSASIQKAIGESEVLHEDIKELKDGDIL
ncbi:hypothetical protein VUR80DRAFT_9398 [Thermomyces stellatus]